MFQILAQPVTSLPNVSSSGSSATVLIIVVVMAFIVGIFIVAFLRSRQRPEMLGMTPERVAATWKNIEAMSTQGVMGAKIAVIEADKLLDGVLKSMMIPGETLGERLKVAGYKYQDLHHVWPAHKLRNQLVHDAAFEITSRQASQALRDYAKALRVLHLL